MKAVYQGIDLVEIGKFRELCARHPGLVEDLFTDAERGYCRAKADPAMHLAARFAAKEACLKALGLGLSEPGLTGAFAAIEVVRHPSGRPGLALKGWPASLAARLAITGWTVSLSHTPDYAVASVLLQAAGEEQTT